MACGYGTCFLGHPVFRKMLSYPPTMSIYALVYNTKYTKHVGTEDHRKFPFINMMDSLCILPYIMINEKFGKSFKFGQF